jgi:hypothetical protein
MSTELAEAAESGAESPQQEEPRQLLEPSPRRGRTALDIAARFDAPGVPTGVEVHAGGHINKSYRVTFSQKTQGGESDSGEDKRYLLQRVNGAVFPEPMLIQHNIERVTSHVQKKLRAAGGGDIERRCLSVVPTKDGALGLADPEGGSDLWRMYPFVEGTKTMLEVTSAAEAFSTAKIFGEFVAIVADMEGPPLHETLKDFHNTPMRLDALDAAVRADSHGRVAEAQKLLKLVDGQRADACVIQQHIDAGELPVRTVHNDTKISNVLFDLASGSALCVVDLDTVMSGSLLHDFGDLCRSVCSLCPEDGMGPDGEMLSPEVDEGLFRAVCSGFIDGAGAVLSDLESELLVLSAQVSLSTAAC